MIEKITGNDLIALGIERGPILGKLLAHAEELRQAGMSIESTLEKLQALHKDELKAQPNIKLRSTPLKITCAIDAHTPEEEENLELSVTKMQELTLSPVVECASLMPDACPSGMEFGSIPVGGAIQTENCVIPAAHSSDLCCSMRATLFTGIADTSRILDAMQSSTHFGPGGRPDKEQAWHPVLEEEIWDNTFLKGLKGIAQQHLQTQGDGNHFFYLGRIENLQNLSRKLDIEGHYKEAKSLKDSKLSWANVLVSHHGSRNLGAQIYKRGVQHAIRECTKLCPKIPKNLAWIDLTSPIGQEYWEAIEYAQRWTKANHKLIHDQTLEKLKANSITTFTNAHNFVWKKEGKILHGKGATPAWKSESGIKKIGIIPLNMSSEILITLGNDNETFLSFSPHGAGRNRSRSKTMEKYKDPITKEVNKKLLEDDFRESTRGLDIRWASKKLDISETPVGYKNKSEIKKQLQEFHLAEIISEINPKGCIMAGEFPNPWKEKKKKKGVEVNPLPSLE